MDPLLNLRGGTIIHKKSPRYWIVKDGVSCKSFVKQVTHAQPCATWHVDMKRPIQKAGFFMSAIQGFGRCGEKKKPIARKRGRNVVDNDHDTNNDDDIKVMMMIRGAVVRYNIQKRAG